MEPVFEYPVSASQVIAGYENEDTSSQVDPGTLFGHVAVDATRRAEEGWRIASIGSMPLRQMGTAANIFLQSGGQYSTRAVVIVVYERS
jgi:hypothetical protein